MIKNWYRKLFLVWKSCTVCFWERYWSTDYEFDVSFLENSTPWKALGNRTDFQKSFFVSKPHLDRMFSRVLIRNRALFFCKTQPPGWKTLVNRPNLQKEFLKVFRSAGFWGCWFPIWHWFSGNFWTIVKLIKKISSSVFVVWTLYLVDYEFDVSLNENQILGCIIERKIGRLFNFFHFTFEWYIFSKLLSFFRKIFLLAMSWKLL